MKKVLMLFLFLFINFFLSGCYNYNDGIVNGQLQDIKIYYAESDVELDVEIEESRSPNYFEGYSAFYGPINLGLEKVNSPQPLWLFYTTTVEETANCLVEFKVKENNGRTFDSITINDINYKREDFNKIEEAEGFLYVTLQISNINIENQEFNIADIFFIKTNDNDSTTIVKGTTWVEVRTYISGVYFYLISKEPSDTLKYRNF